MLKECIDNFELLKQHTFDLRFKRGSKNEKSISISFHDADFFHLAGLGYLSDLEKKFSRITSKGRTYRLIKKDEKLRNAILNSRDFPLIQNRILILSNLINILNDTVEIFDYKSLHWTLIEADYAIKHRTSGNQCILFIRARGDGYFVGCSIVDDKRSYFTDFQKYKTTYKRFNKKNN